MKCVVRFVRYHRTESVPSRGRASWRRNWRGPHNLTSMLRESGFSAIGARLEARLRTHEMRVKSAETAIKAENFADPSAIFVLPETTSAQRIPAPVTDATTDLLPSNEAEHSVGATFRRKGMLSDVPMPVTRVGEGVVYTTFSDAQGSQEMAFDATQIDIVSKPPVLTASNDIEFFPNLKELVKSASPIAAAATPEVEAVAITTASYESRILAAMSPANTTAASPPEVLSSVNSAVPESIRTANETTATSDTTTTAATARSTANILPAGAIRLSDGTLQFGYAPTGGVINLVPNKPEPAPTAFGIGATVRRKGVISDAPLTVTEVGSGYIRAVRTDSQGTTTFEFPFNQFDLVTAAP